jgi:hypothetical protein
VRRLKRKRLERGAAVNALLTAANQEWRLDFMCDGVASGRVRRVLDRVIAARPTAFAATTGRSLRAGISSPGASSAASR